MTDLPRLIFWCGPKHSGKTTAAQRLIEKVEATDITVAGLLSLSIYENDVLTGFDGLDIQSGERLHLLDRNKTGGGFSFTSAGFSFAEKALSLTDTQNAALVIVDEFGPMELSGGGLHQSVDKLIAATQTPIMIVVRKELLEKVKGLYIRLPSIGFDALDPVSTDKVIDILLSRKTSVRHE